MTTSTQLVAHVLAKVLTTLETAAVLNALLCAQDDERLDDIEAAVGQEIFDELCDYSPQAMEIAQHG